ncbi:hypothetical protein V7S43_012538 [Phytophthora oleae]|uniref:Alpha-carbonic anhydrase domain-containing protein n=1 Tax=Phytophthora oleae TaxID=2107226 RepID=A0ABD3F5U3_9STRA
MNRPTSRWPSQRQSPIDIETTLADLELSQSFTVSGTCAVTVNGASRARAVGAHERLAGRVGAGRAGPGERGRGGVDVFDPVRRPAADAQGVFNYAGSLTTPACSEIVDW